MTTTIQFVFCYLPTTGMTMTGMAFLTVFLSALHVLTLALAALDTPAYTAFSNTSCGYDTESYTRKLY